MRISEAAELTGLSISNIRFYEKKGLIEPAREVESKYRDYTDEDVARLKQIVFYRKMDLPLERIDSLIKNEISLEEVLKEQMQELVIKQQMLQGSIDLCQKVLDDHAKEPFDIDYYLNYVKEEEAKGTKFAEVEEFLTELASFSHYDRMWLIGDPYVGRFFANTWVNRIVIVLLGAFWIIIPIIGIVDAVADEEAFRPVSLLLWVFWTIVFVVSFMRFRRSGKKK